MSQSAREPEEANAERDRRRTRALYQELVVRAAVALAALAFNELERLGVGGHPNPVTRAAALAALGLNGVYWLAAGTRWRVRLQAHLRLFVDITLVTVGLYGVGGMAAAQYIGVYTLIPVYVGIVLSSSACIVASALATASYLVMVRLAGAPPGAGPATFLGGAWRVVAFNLLVLNLVGILTAVLSHAYRQSRRRTRASEERFRAVTESAIDAIVITDAGGTIVSSNRSAQTMFGYAPDEIAGQPVRRLMPERYRAVYDQAAARAAAGTDEAFGAGRTVEVQALRKDGREFFADLAISSWQTGGTVFFSAIVRDVTRRKQAEQALRESEERFRGLFEQAAVGVYRRTLKGQVLLANPALVRMLGFKTFEELAGCNLETEDIIPPPQRRQFREALDREQQITGFEATWRRRDGRPIFVRESSRLIRAGDGRPLYYEGTVEDITDRRTLEEQLRQSQKMDALGRLAGGVAHDFNNLLTAILGYGALLAQSLPEGHTGRGRAEEIVAAAHRASSLTKQLLTLSRGEVLERRPLNVNAVVADMDSMLGRLIGEDIEVATTLDRALHPVRADAGQLQQVILNLAINARDAMPSGGRLTIETGNVQLDDAYARGHLDVTPGPYVMLAVSDTGCGMDPETQSHIFEPFFTTKPEGKGTGLGLATVYGIVKQSGGAIAVYSEVGRGTTVRIYLPPVAGTAQRTGTPRPHVDLPRGTERILLVEDEALVRDLTADILRASGYSVIEAEHPLEALARLGDQEIDLMITDIVMPRMSGPDIARRLLEDRPHVKVLFVSGYAGSHMENAGGLPPGSGFLAKPFTPATLASKVREVLGTGAPPGPRGGSPSR